MMTDPQIEALARVYAEVMNPVDDYSEVSIIYERPIDMDIDYDGAKRFLTWLSQRYCIVEKDKVEEEYHEASVCRPHFERYSPQWGALTAKMAVLERLFPSIAKEMEE